MKGETAFQTFLCYNADYVGGENEGEGEGSMTTLVEQSLKT